jgi:predicted 3-demethylubiquinone-9 3-methyltransferase (glyoxalase superfamily)
VSWQIVSSDWGEMLSGDDRKAEATMQAVLQMKKLDMAKIRHAYEQA